MSKSSPLQVRAHTGDFEDSTKLSSPLSPGNKGKPVLKRALTSQNGNNSPTASLKKAGFRFKSVTVHPPSYYVELQHEIAVKRGNKDIAKFERKLLPKRSLLGDAAAVRKDKAKRIARNRALVAERLQERRRLLASRAGNDTDADESVVVEAEMIGTDHKWTPFSEVLQFDKSHTSKETIAR